MKRRRSATLIAVFLACLCSVAASDSLRTADSLRDRHSELPLWSDSTFARPDSLGGGERMMDRWWAPLGVIILTGAAAWLLYSTRSK